jgi:alkylresorcinol/alkylpyrone synthase
MIHQIMHSHVAVAPAADSAERCAALPEAQECGDYSRARACPSRWGGQPHLRKSLRGTFSCSFPMKGESPKRPQTRLFSVQAIAQRPQRVEPFIKSSTFFALVTEFREEFSGSPDPLPQNPQERGIEGSSAGSHTDNQTRSMYDIILRDSEAMRIASAASAFPKHYYSQKFLLERLQDYWGDQLKNPLLLARLHRNVTVDGRYLAIPTEQYLDITTWGQANDIWIKVAQELGEQALCLALHNAGLKPHDLGALLFTTVTGIASPSIDALLINRMGLPANIRRTPIFGLGCVAGAAGIARAADYVRAYPSQAAALVSVELCSLTLQREDLEVANLISSGLFADGSAAVIVTGAEFESPGSEISGPKILATRSIFYPGTEEMMGWNISEKGFRIVLSTEVPNLIRQNLGRDVDAFLADNGYRRSDLRSWVLHTGGPKVLEACSTALGLHHGQLDASWDCLRKVGNLSSASVLVVLEDVMKHRRPEPGAMGLLAAMGPGFCSELLLLQW